MVGMLLDDAGGLAWAPEFINGSGVCGEGSWNETRQALTVADRSAELAKMTCSECKASSKFWQVLALAGDQVLLRLTQHDLGQLPGKASAIGLLISLATAAWQCVTWVR